MNTEQRIEKLEQSLTHIKLLVVLLLALLVFLVTTTSIFKSTPASADEGTKVIRAKKFVVIDEKGRARAEFGWTELASALFGEEALGLVFLTENGFATLTVRKDGPRLSLFTENNGQMSLAVEKNGPEVSLATMNNGFATLQVSTASNRLKGPPGPQLNLINNGESVTLVSTKDASKLHLFNSDSGSDVILMTNEDGARLKLGADSGDMNLMVYGEPYVSMMTPKGLFIMVPKEIDKGNRYGNEDCRLDCTLLPKEIDKGNSTGNKKK